MTDKHVLWKESLLKWFCFGSHDIWRIFFSLAIVDPLFLIKIFCKTPKIDLMNIFLDSGNLWIFLKQILIIKSFCQAYGNEILFTIVKYSIETNSYRNCMEEFIKYGKLHSYDRTTLYKVFLCNFSKIYCYNYLQYYWSSHLTNWNQTW